MPRGEGIGVVTTQWADALLHNGLGDYERASAAAQRVLEPPRRLDATIGWALPELVEAAARCDQPEIAHDALERLTGMARAAGTDWALGLEARSRALLSEGAPAEALYREAIERLGRTRVRGEHARAHLLYGEWLRRERPAQGRPRAAARRAPALRATWGWRRSPSAPGASCRPPARRRASARPTTRDELTPQEEQIARLARDGLTNSEIGGQLFLSPRTVEWHLRKVFTKLGISSRMGLHDALARDSAPA